MMMILSILDKKCPLELTFYDLEHDDETVSALSPEHQDNSGFLIRFSTVNNDQYYALIYFSQEGLNNIHHLFKYDTTNELADTGAIEEDSVDTVFVGQNAVYVRVFCCISGLCFQELNTHEIR